ncbi:hypothetical protein A4A49_07201 [Nicotiana attenuata]|uniref:Uncharacterized protein n=1 Tax=Nicotiana attenuata TaxID=49451 RepID=A0A314L7J8_NICAT|nr:hypothetical protein A4A49_07201 [Nicotiana attenuata]
MEACKVFNEMFEKEIDHKHNMDVGNTNDQVFNISSLSNVTTLLPITPMESAFKDGKSEEVSDVKVLVEGSVPVVQPQLTATSLIKEAANIEQELVPEHFCPILQHLAHMTDTEHLEKIMWNHLEYIIKSRVPSLQSLINQTMTELEIELSPHRNQIITAPGINSKTLTLRFYSEYVVSTSMTHVWDPRWQCCTYFSISLSDFALVVATSSIFNLFDNYLEKNNQNKKRKKMELFVFSYHRMSLTYEDGCQVLLDACALDPKDMETRDILLKAFKSDSDNSQVEASTLSCFSLHSTENDLVLVPVEPFWSYFIIVGSHTLSSGLYVIFDSIASTCPSIAGEEYTLVLDEYLDVKHKVLVENFTWSIVSQYDFSTALDCETEICYMILVGMNHIAPLHAIIGFQNYVQFDEIQTSIRGPVEIVERNGDEHLVKVVYANNWSPKICLRGLIIHLFVGRKNWYTYIVTIGDGGVLQYFEYVVVADIGSIFASMEIICMLQVLYQDKALFLYTLTTIVMLISTLVFGFLKKSLVSHLLSYHDSTKSIDREPSIAESATITFLRAMDICSCCLKDLYMHSILTGGSMLAYIGSIFGEERVASSVPNSNLEDKVLFE